MYTINTTLLVNSTKQHNISIGKQRALGLDIWPIPTLASVRGYSCMWTQVDAREYSVLSTRFNTCLP